MNISYNQARPASYDPVQSTSTFIYPGAGRRVKKTGGGQTIRYVKQYYEKNLTALKLSIYNKKGLYDRYISR